MRIDVGRGIERIIIFGGDKRTVSSALTALSMTSPELHRIDRLTRGEEADEEELGDLGFRCEGLALKLRNSLMDLAEAQEGARIHPKVTSLLMDNLTLFIEDLQTVPYKLLHPFARLVAFVRAGKGDDGLENFFVG